MSRNHDNVPAIEVERLSKVFRLGLSLRRVDALRSISFSVPQGTVFGFLGPNGAGKTTCIKLLTGLIHPSAGSARLFGQPVGARGVASRVGYLPEQPYFYDYLTGMEILCFYGRLFGRTGPKLRRHATDLLYRVGLSDAKDRAVRKYSKGMMQRLGLASALINDPDLIILDEPMSGLDPIGRKEVRDLMIDLKRAGKTIFFSSHILSDIEMICDRVAILDHGSILDEGVVSGLLARAGDRVEVLVRNVGPQDGDPQDGVPCVLGTVEPERLGDLWRYEIAPEDVGDALATLLARKLVVVSVSPRRATLEDLFILEVQAHSMGAGHAPEDAA